MNGYINNNYPKLKLKSLLMEYIHVWGDRFNMNSLIKSIVLRFNFILIYLKIFRYGNCSLQQKKSFGKLEND